MHAAQITSWDQPAPTYVEIPTPEPPPESAQEIQIRVAATALHQTVRSRASGKHYSATGPMTGPITPGVDGTGTTPDGRAVFFVTLNSAHGSFADVVNVPDRQVFELPAGLDKVQAAACVNPAMSSWMALQHRVQGLQPGFTVLVLGATSLSGSIAVSFARTLGAGKVIGAARSEGKLAGLGLDEVVVLREPVAETDFSGLGDVDVILDYVYGAAAVHCLQSLQSSRPTQYVHIGSLGGKLDISLPGSVLRSKDITIRGSGKGSWSMRELRLAMPQLLEALVKVKPVEVEKYGLKEVGEVWGSENKGLRKVFLPEGGL